MDYNNAEEEIQNAICEMKKSLILEIKDNNNDLRYLVDEKKEKENLIELENMDQLGKPNFSNKVNNKMKLDKIDNNKYKKFRDITKR